MLLTLSTRSLQHAKRAKAPLGPMDVPDFVAEELGLKGLNVHTPLLKGMVPRDLEALRDRADRARCPILVLVDETALDFGPDSGPASIERVAKLGLCASKLGAPAVAVELALLPEAQFDAYAANVKRSLAALDKFDTHLLVRPGQGAGDPQRLADMIKKIGGFRIGSMPTFAHAAASGDAADTLRRLAPYAQAVEASVKGFSKAGKHQSWDLAGCLDAIRNVGYQNTLCIDYAGKTDPVGNIERARDLFAKAIDPGEDAEAGDEGDE
ncbi:MAG: TIM barrel protein [Planctomycetes bacterium]|nr:TIM barrel protein [Planctomycetota bacterium]